MLFVLTLHLLRKKKSQSGLWFEGTSDENKSKAFVKVSYVKADDGVKANAYQERPGFSQINLW
jgi:hypothetical protein